MARPVFCPACGFATIDEDHFGVTIDRCCQCHGLWFDPGELESLSHHISTKPDLRSIAVRSPTAIIPTVDLRCPRCDDSTVDNWYQNDGIPVFICASCHGIFLPGKSIEALAQQTHWGRCFAADAVLFDASYLSIEVVAEIFEFLGEVIADLFGALL